ncbi:iron-sulfur cluster repair di-iron protein [Clostridium sp. A1-XYC3]|uniref:Iron-sulfur cluster repair di-iron protein n=1 Tax=Clostridium tanneri TaxID=3037988 RepID=A0ABU4JXT5_9CLOT|nr:iron-sulfur cluster repair di-iron protein [Clostridium sp. A1-XYC3]MDW8802990.1 iron-sulfur cluster repair di-iron protein [Clostridium sp. A1-XYC3]
MSKFTFKSSDSVGHIAANFPKSMDIFKEYNIDFCCGGDTPLIEEIKEHNLNEEEIMSKLEEAYNKAVSMGIEEVDFNNLSYSDLIDHIVNVHHAYLQRELPKIGELTAKILRVHGGGHSELAEVHRLFSSLRMELEQHTIKEETSEFPMIKEYEKTHSKELLDKIVKSIKGLEEEHEGAGDILKALRRATKGFKVPEDGCNTYRLTYDKLKELESETFVHIHLENNILFPRVVKENNN